MTKTQKQKLLVLVDWFAPGYKAGGPIQSCVNLCRVLSEEFEIYVLTTDTDHGETNAYPGIEANKWLYNDELFVHVYYTRKSTLSVKQLAAQILLVNPDVVYLNHLFSPMFVLFPLWLKFIGKMRSKVVICPRGALYQSALSLKSYKKKPLLLLYKYLGITKIARFHATNQREQAAIKTHFPDAKILIADNLPNTRQPVFGSTLKMIGILSCIFIARIVPIKNLLFLLNVLKSIKGNVSLTIVGPIEDEMYFNECTLAIKELPQNVVVNYIGAKSNDELVKLIQAHHLFVLPTTGENFGHAIFEAFLSGRPVLISDQTPWLNLQQQSLGWDIPLKNPEEFKAAITTTLNFNQQQFDEYAKAAWAFAKSFIAGSATKQQYITLFREPVKKSK